MLLEIILLPPRVAQKARIARADGSLVVANHEVLFLGPTDHAARITLVHDGRDRDLTLGQEPIRMNQKPSSDSRCLGRERRRWAAARFELVRFALDEDAYAGGYNASVARQVEPLHACLLATFAANLTHVGDNDDRDGVLAHCCGIGADPFSRVGHGCGRTGALEFDDKDVLAYAENGIAGLRPRHSPRDVLTIDPK